MRQSSFCEENLVNEGEAFICYIPLLLQNQQTWKSLDCMFHIDTVEEGAYKHNSDWHIFMNLSQQRCLYYFQFEVDIHYWLLSWYVCFVLKFKIWMFFFQQRTPQPLVPPVQSMEDDEEESLTEEIEEEVAEEVEEEITPEEAEDSPSTPTPQTPSTPARLAAEMKESETEESEAPPIESDSEGVMTVAAPPKRQARMPKSVSLLQSEHWNASFFRICVCVYVCVCVCVWVSGILGFVFVIVVVVVLDPIIDLKDVYWIKLQHFIWFRCCISGLCLCNAHWVVSVFLGGFVTCVTALTGIPSVSASAALDCCFHGVWDWEVTCSVHEAHTLSRSLHLW